MSLNKILIAMAFAFALTACSKTEEAPAVDAAAEAVVAADAVVEEAPAQ